MENTIIKESKIVFPIFSLHLVVVLLSETLAQYYLPLSSIKGTWNASTSIIINGLARWDSGWYLGIAKNGYPVNDKPATAFLPLYPELIGHLSRLIRPMVGMSPHSTAYYAFVGIVLSNVFFFISLVFLYRISKMFLSELRTVWFLWILAMFPTAFYFSAVYPSSLFLMFSAASFYFGYTQKWWIAGTCIGLGTLADNFGVFLALALLVMVLKDYRKENNLRRSLACAAAVTIYPAVLFSSYLIFLWARFGDPFEFLNAEKYWGRHYVWPWHAFYSSFLHSGLDFLTCVIVLTLLIMSYKSLPFELWLYSALSFLVPLISVTPSGDPTSIPRYVAEIFPLMIYAGDRMRNSRTQMAYLSFSIVFLVVLTGAFANWYWVA